jgi:hypothetical protein
MASEPLVVAFLEPGACLRLSQLPKNDEGEIELATVTLVLKLWIVLGGGLP